MENEKEYYQGYEKTPFLQLGNDWAKQVASKFKQEKRLIKVFLENIEGQSVFIPRFLTPIRPPEGVFQKEDKRAIERAARFVSLIPFVEDAQLFQDMPDLTCDS